MPAVVHRIVGSGYANAISRAIETLPPRLRERVAHVDFLAGVDPVFVGLHRETEIGDGRSYRDVAHFVDARRQAFVQRDRRRPTIVIPTLEHATPSVVIHELGHALDFSLWPSRPRMRAVNDYAKTNQREAFAEAFRAWLAPDPRRLPLVAIDCRASAFFDGIA